MKELYKPGALKTIIVLIVVGLGLYFCYYMHHRVSQLEGQVAVLETIKVGIPVEYLDGRGLKPRRKLAIKYQNQSAELRVYRSSGVTAVTSRDFIIIVNREGVIVAAFDITSETPHDQVLGRLGVDLTDL